MGHTAFPANAALDDRLPGGAAGRDRGRVESVESLWDDLGRLARQLRLASLEPQRAGGSLVPVLLCAAVVGALVIIAWLGVVLATALWLIGS